MQGNIWALNRWQCRTPGTAIVISFTSRLGFENICASAAVVLCLLFVSPMLATETSVLIERCSLLDPESGIMLPEQTIVIRGDKIVRVTRADDAGEVPSEAVVIDGRGKFVLPGLIDAHVHVVHVLDFAHMTGDEVLPLYLAAGVTSIRSTGDELILKQATPDRVFCVVFRFSWCAAALGASDSLEVHQVQNSALRRLQQLGCGEAGRPIEAQRLRHQMPPKTRGRGRVVGRHVYKFRTATMRQKIGCESFHASRRYTVRRPVVRI